QTVMAVNLSNSIVLNNPGLKMVLNVEEPRLSETEQEFETEETEHTI
ncbi:41732_t:CDS:1, partial [Gigaspora margarita]